jgi:hypothetical protein
VKNGKECVAPSPVACVHVFVLTVQTAVVHVFLLTVQTEAFVLNSGLSTAVRAAPPVAVQQLRVCRPLRGEQSRDKHSV